MNLLKFFNSDEWRILWPFYISELISTTFLFFTPYMIIYFLDIGLSFFQISVLFAIYMITPIIFEIPTGAIADVFGRKKSVVLSWFLAGIFILALFFTFNFYLIVLIFFLLSISTTLSSGADEAWIIDLLKHNKKSNLTQNYYIKVQSITSFGIVLMGVLSAIFVKYFSINGIWIVSGIGTLISGLILLNAKEHFKKQKVNIKKTFEKTISNSKESLIYSFKHKNLLFLLLALIFVSLSLGINGNMWQPFLRDIGLKPYLLGYVYSIISLFNIATPFLSKPLLKKIGKEKYYLAITTLVMFLILLSIYFANIIILAIAIMVLFETIWGLDRPVSQNFFQKFVPSKIRATTGSVKSMVTSVGWTIGILIAGIIADQVGAQTTIVYSGFFILPAIVFYLLIKDKK